MDYEKKPKFKVGDTIRHNVHGDKYCFTIRMILQDAYVLDDDLVLTFNMEDSWELAESEDEKIRKGLIGTIHLAYDCGCSISKEQHDKYIAYIEKQSEQKPVEIIPMFRVGDTLKKKGKDYTFIVDRIQGGFYHCDEKNGAFFPINEQYEWELVEQNPAWSEDDETTRNNISHIIKQYDKINKRNNQPCWYIGDCLLWMQNIKGKIKPQLKQEWSEEDEFHIKSIESTIEYCKKEVAENEDARYLYNEDLNWLKSLRTQNQWKPSDEQIIDLERVINEFIPSSYKEIRASMENLLQQLKAL